MLAIISQFSKSLVAMVLSHQKLSPNLRTTVCVNMQNKKLPQTPPICISEVVL